MKIKKLDARGFSHDILAVFVVVAMAIGGTAYYVASKADTPNTGTVVSGLSGLCLNQIGKVANDDPTDVVPCKQATQDWQIKTLTGNHVAITVDGGKDCVGVNAPDGRLALTAKQLQEDQAAEGGAAKSPHKIVQPNPLVQLFGCRSSQASFDSSFQQWASIDKMLVNVNPLASLNGVQLCMTASASGKLVRLATCTGNACPIRADQICPANVVTPSVGQQWTLPIGKNTPPPATPVVSLKANPVSVVKGGSSTLTWSVKPTSTMCTASSMPSVAAWSGAKGTGSGIVKVSNLQATTAFKLTCRGQGGTGAASATVTVTSSGGGGAAGNVSCNYQADTWSGDAAKVGYSVSKLSSSNGNPASFSVKLNAKQGTTEVVGYPSVQCLMYAALPTNLVSTFKDTPPVSSSGLDYEYAYDIWLTTATAAKVNNWNNDLELMIWNYVHGQVPAGSVKSTLADGSKVWVSGSNTTGTVSVVLPKNETSGSVNIASIISQLKAKGYISSNYGGILDVEYGIEAPYGGGQTFTVNSLSVAE